MLGPQVSINADAPVQPPDTHILYQSPEAAAMVYTEPSSSRRKISSDHPPTQAESMSQARLLWSDVQNVVQKVGSKESLSVHAVLDSLNRQNVTMPALKLLSSRQARRSASSSS